eukprot:CAMPEP_0113311960 /NCGR_PEP_ID=MMETSP0010_2-20120614/8977_1 /TAXON_ID=216773 ORGANISM="Corethron hystrix, Strain 308" /NCGR_SAMPLE_ID=MMETSP0010_2 /ASSEMBLY_ACC=CAM_ASM_000155 /LENGTH=322 /DNA_ID=CAMNT_0000167681 /DNA_START=521 /DNA_END=1489 /DNA_ORIENTATION=+ /assembly_acc=CAM_ASM_000155
MNVCRSIGLDRDDDYCEQHSFGIDEDYYDNKFPTAVISEAGGGGEVNCLRLDAEYWERKGRTVAAEQALLRALRFDGEVCRPHRGVVAIARVMNVSTFESQHSGDDRLFPSSSGNETEIAEILKRGEMIEMKGGSDSKFLVALRHRLVHGAYEIINVLPFVPDVLNTPTDDRYSKLDISKEKSSVDCGDVTLHSSTISDKIDRNPLRRPCLHLASAAIYMAADRRRLSCRLDVTLAEEEVIVFEPMIIDGVESGKNDNGVGDFSRELNKGDGVKFDDQGKSPPLMGLESCDNKYKKWWRWFGISDVELFETIHDIEAGLYLV